MHRYPNTGATIEVAGIVATFLAHNSVLGETNTLFTVRATSSNTRSILARCKVQGFHAAELAEGILEVDMAACRWPKVLGDDIADDDCSDIYYGGSLAPEAAKQVIHFQRQVARLSKFWA